jgi:hypothetical protein
LIIAFSPHSQTGLFILQFTREWEHLAKGARIVDVSQAQITDTSGWSKEFIQENLAKATSVRSPTISTPPACTH